jgi:hypothetical protein
VSDFEVIVGKSVRSFGEDADAKSPSQKRLGFVQTLDTKPKRRLYEVLQSQGLQMNQEITFLSALILDSRVVDCEDGIY